MRRPRLAYVVTHPVSADLLLRGQLAFMKAHGFDVTVIAAPGTELSRVAAREQVRTIAVPMPRGSDPRRDIVALARLVQVFRALQPDIVNAGTTKAGLLGIAAARIARVPIRIYLLRGLRLETVTGVMGTILGVTERIASACAHDVACVSPSLLRLAVDGGYIPRSKAFIVANGSSNGVDTERFGRTPALRVEGERLFSELGVGSGDRIIGFVGRLASDKGITELLEAFARVRAEVPGAKLVLLGGDIGDENIEPGLLRAVAAAADVVSTGHIANLAPYYARIDVLAFPSYREGFPNVPLEAACAEVPVVAFRSTGTVDAVVDGETGTLVEQGDVANLARAIVTYLQSPAHAGAHGRAARARAERLFSRRTVWDAWLNVYRERLQRLGLPLPTEAL